MGNCFIRGVVVVGALSWVGLCGAQTPDPAYAALDQAYKSLAAKDYDRAIASFQAAIAAAPERPDVRKDLGYTLLKSGQSEAARDQFEAAMRLRPEDQQTALEYAYLCYETRQPIQARRTFDRLRKAGNAMATEAFENVDLPLREGIARWQQALQLDPKNFSAHEELARLAEQRDDLALAGAQYESAWRLRVDRRDLLLDLARVWAQMDRGDDATAALIAAWRGGTARVSEEARDLLPGRYPYLSEFERALQLDSSNAALREDVQFQRGGTVSSQPAPALQARPDPEPSAAADMKALGIASYEKGFLNDALKYLETAHEDDPVDFDVMLKLGWTYNMLKDDQDALRWFDLARRSPDPQTSAEASRAYRGLASDVERFRTTVWVFPLFSSRWTDVFGYAQGKTEVRLASAPFLRPYVSMRLLGDLKGTLDTGFGAQYLSERSVIFAGGLATVPRHGWVGWFEAGEAVIYRQAQGQARRTIPDYRGGVSYSKGFGHQLTGSTRGAFAETADDGLFVSRFENDSLLYLQNRAGFTRGKAQALWNLNITADSKRQYWANFVETGPGVRFRVGALPVLYSVNLLRGVYLVNSGNPRKPNYDEVRVGVWYAFTR
jgi:tetratricopeptide (TPR) repeat protein